LAATRSDVDRETTRPHTAAVVSYVLDDRSMAFTGDALS